MKYLSLVFMLALSSTSLANPYGNQNPYGSQTPYGNISQQDMNNMMQQMQEAQACMAKVDQRELKALEQRAKTFESDMRAMCKAGKRSQAQSEAISFSKEVMNNASVKQLRACSEKMQGSMKNMMQQMQQNIPMANSDTDYSSSHVCDGF